MDLKRFVSEQNIARYRSMLARCKDDKQRRLIDRLLSEEIATRNAGGVKSGQ